MTIGLGGIVVKFYAVKLANRNSKKNSNNNATKYPGAADAMWDGWSESSGVVGVCVDSR